MSENPKSSPAKSRRKTRGAGPRQPIHQESESIEKQPERVEEKTSTEKSDQIEKPTPGEESSEERLNGDARIGEIIETCPEAERILEKHFRACAKCPAIAAETISFQVSIHGADLKSVLDELDKLCR
ncbi:MAG: hypothetical protein ACFFBS_02840 [Promethearchaeota archaeon]